jgi:hypothetical protein
LLAEPLGQPLTYDTRGDVGGAAGGKAHDQAHRPRRIGLRPRNAAVSAKIVQLYRSRTNRSSAAAKVFLSLHFLFQDLTQYQE